MPNETKLDNMNISKEEIEKLAEEYAENENSCYTNDYYGFINGFNKALSLLDVVGQSEQFFAFTDRYFSKDKELAEALRPEYESWLKSKGK